MSEGQTIKEAAKAPDANTLANRQYFQEAIGLRLCMQWNADDSEFVSKGGRIVYLMDANVLVFFMNPFRETRLVNAFELSGGAAKQAVGTAVITAEFLFSRNLAGQCGYPALIAPSHADELAELLDRMRHRVATPTSAEKPLTDGIRRQLEELIQRVRRDDIPRDSAVKQLRGLVPDIAPELLESEFQEANQFLRLYRDDLIRPLAVHPEATSDVLDIGHSDAATVNEWTDMILQERMRATKAREQFRATERGRHGSPPSVASEKRRARRDAEALIQTIRLDAAAQQARQATRYVLVSADRALYDAYANWFWRDNKGEQTQTRFVLRQLLQYLPMLNLVDMPNGIESADIFVRARDALDTLLAPLRSVDPHRYPESLSIHRILARITADDAKLQEAMKGFYGQNPFEFKVGSAPLLEQVRRDWEEGFRISVVLNADLMRRRARSEFDALASLLRENVDLRTAMLEDQQKILSQLEAAHLAVNTRVSVARLMANIDRTDGVAPARGVLAIRAVFPRIVGDMPLEAVLDELASGKNDNLALRVEVALQRALDHEALFFAACVAHRGSRWHTALHYAQRALALLESGLASESRGASEAERHEIGYLAASATRYALPSVEAIRRAISLLDQGRAFARRHKDKFGLARAICEFSSLVLVLIYRSQLLGGNPDALDPTDVDDLRRVHDQLEEVRSMLAELRHEAHDAAQAKLVDVLELQAWANVISAEVIVHHFESADPRREWLRPSRALLSQALIVMEAKLSFGACPPVVEGEHIMARFWNGSMDRSEAAGLLQLAQARGNAGKHKLTEIDEAEFAWFAAILTERDEGRRLPGSVPVGSLQ